MSDLRIEFQAYHAGIPVNLDLARVNNLVSIKLLVMLNILDTPQNCDDRYSNLPQDNNNDSSASERKLKPKGPVFSANIRRKVLNTRRKLLIPMKMKKPKFKVRIVLPQISVSTTTKFQKILI